MMFLRPFNQGRNQDVYVVHLRELCQILKSSRELVNIFESMCAIVNFLSYIVIDALVHHIRFGE